MADESPVMRARSCQWQPVTNSFGDGRAGDGGFVVEVGDGACDFERAVVTAGGQRESRRDRGEQGAGDGIDRGAAIDPGATRLSVASNAGLGAVPRALARAGRLDARADGG